MPARRDPVTGRFLPAQSGMVVEPVVAPAPTPARRRIRAAHVAALLALLVLLAAVALVVFT